MDNSTVYYISFRIVLNSVTCKPGGNNLSNASAFLRAAVPTWWVCTQHPQVNDTTDDIQWIKKFTEIFPEKKVVSSGESMTSNFSLMCVSSTKGTIQLRFSMFLQYKLRAFVQVKLDAIFLTLENSILSNSLGCWLDLEIKTPLWMC